MPIIPLIYFAILTILFFKKEQRLGIATMLTIIFLVSAICGVMIDQMDLYSMYGVREKEVSLSATFIYCVGITLVIYPFSLLRAPDAENFQIDKPLMFKIISYTIVVCFLIFIISQGSAIKEAIVTDPSNVKAEHYENLDFEGENMGQSIFLYLPNIIASAWSLSLLLWFVSITYMHNNIILNAGLLLSSLQGILSATLIAGRASIIYWIFCFACYLVFFLPQMQKQVKRRMIISAGIIAALIVAFFSIITISRFADRSNNGALESLVGYAGQPYNNFCAIFTHAHNLPFNLERLFPLTYKYVLGYGSFHLTNYYESIESIIGIAVNCFYTLLGGMYLTIGLGGMVFFLIVYIICACFTTYCITTTHRFAYLILLSALILVPIQGMFDVPFPYVKDSLINLLTITLFFMFNYSLKKQ